jgi:NADPH-dependent curcumin reductase CurA
VGGSLGVGFGEAGLAPELDAVERSDDGVAAVAVSAGAVGVEVEDAAADHALGEELRVAGTVAADGAEDCRIVRHRLGLDSSIAFRTYARAAVAEASVPT